MIYIFIFIYIYIYIYIWLKFGGVEPLKLNQDFMAQVWWGKPLILNPKWGQPLPATEPLIKHGCEHGQI